MIHVKEMKARQFPGMFPVMVSLLSFSGKFMFCVRSSFCGVAIAKENLLQ